MAPLDEFPAPPGRLVRVWWYDHAGGSGWTEEPDELELCCTVGFLLADTDRYIRLASSYNVSGQVGSWDVLVRGAIVSIEEIDEFRAGAA